MIPPLSKTYQQAVRFLSKKKRKTKTKRKKGKKNEGKKNNKEKSWRCSIQIYNES
jgi:hypothetical protein